MNFKSCLWAVIIPSLSLVLLANTYYIKPGGLAIGTGSPENPFGDFQTALKRAGGGHTYIFMPGVYSGKEIVVEDKYGGTAYAPTVLRSMNKYEAVIHGSTGDGIVIRNGAKWTIVDGFTVRGSKLNGIRCSSDYVAIQNCRVHNNCGMGISSHGYNNVIIEKNIVEFNGDHIKFEHGIYADGENLIIRNNIVRFNASWGLHLYPDIRNSEIVNNLVYGNNGWGILVASKTGPANNRIVNNTVVNNGRGIITGPGWGDVIMNNIVVNNLSWTFGDDEPIQTRQGLDINKNKVDYNLVLPKMKNEGPNTISADPGFADPRTMHFVLKPSSPAVGKGNPGAVPEIDFFGNDIDKTKAVDIGCFPARYTGAYMKLVEKMNNRWPFFDFGDTEFEKKPDIWSLNLSDKETKE